MVMPTIYDKCIGVDIGAKFTKAVVMEDSDKVLGRAMVETGVDQKSSAGDAIRQALRMSKVAPEDVKTTITTGAGKAALDYATKQVSPVVAAARGAYWFFPSARTVIDVGAEEARVMKLDSTGKIKSFAINERCAAGAGVFVEAMARALESSVDDFAKMSLESKKRIPMNAQCTIFAESEVVTLVHDEVPISDIARAVHDAIAERIFGMIGRVGIEESVILVGGLAKNLGFVTSLKNATGVDILVPEQPEYAAAIGAALSVD